VCGNLFELLEAVDSAEPDVVVTDIRMPPSQSDEGIRAADRIRATRPDVGVFGARDLLPPRFVLATPEARRPGVATRPASCGARSRGARFEERVDLPRELVSRPAVGAA
jgi:CheY-like chemotaxis protein